MPMQRDRYPANWPELVQACKEKAGWRCEQCGVPHGTERIGRKSKKPYAVRLAAAHLDHDPENPNPRLKALCEVCHQRYDALMHGKNARSTKYRKRRQSILDAGQLELFEEEPSVINSPNLTFVPKVLVVTEAAPLLGVKAGQVHAMIQSEKLPSHLATPEELAELLRDGRIKSVPVSGVRVITHEDILAAQNRPKRGWVKGRPRKKR